MLGEIFFKVSEIKNSFIRFVIRLGIIWGQNQINRNHQTEIQKEKRVGGKKSEDSIQGLWDIIKWSNMHVIGSIEEEENGKIYIY